MLKLNPSLLDKPSKEVIQNKPSKEVIQMLWFSLLFTEVNSSLFLSFRESRKTELRYGIKSNQSPRLPQSGRLLVLSGVAYLSHLVAPLLRL